MAALVTVERTASELSKLTINEEVEPPKGEEIEAMLSSLKSTEENPWVLVDTHAFDEHLKDIGVPWIMRKAICAFSPSELDGGVERGGVAFSLFLSLSLSLSSYCLPFSPLSTYTPTNPTGQIITPTADKANQPHTIGAHICVRTPMMDVVTPAKVGERGTNSRGSEFDARIVELSGQGTLALETRVHLNEQGHKKDIVSLRFRDGKHMALMMYCQEDEGERKISAVKCVRTFALKE